MKAQPHFEKSKKFADNVEKQNPFLKGFKSESQPSKDPLTLSEEPLFDTTTFQPDKSCTIPGSIFNTDTSSSIKQKGKKISKAIKPPVKAKQVSLSQFNQKEMENREQIFGPSLPPEMEKAKQQKESKDTQSSQQKKVTEFKFGQMGQTVKIDFDMLKSQTGDQINSELQKSCVELIDQLAFYYNNFNSKMLLSDPSSGSQESNYEEIQQYM